MSICKAPLFPETPRYDITVTWTKNTDDRWISHPFSAPRRILGILLVFPSSFRFSETLLRFGESAEGDCAGDDSGAAATGLLAATVFAGALFADVRGLET